MDSMTLEQKTKKILVSTFGKVIAGILSASIAGGIIATIICKAGFPAINIFVLLTAIFLFAMNDKNVYKQVDYVRVVIKVSFVLTIIGMVFVIIGCIGLYALTSITLPWTWEEINNYLVDNLEMTEEQVEAIKEAYEYIVKLHSLFLILSLILIGLLVVSIIFHTSLFKLLINLRDGLDEGNSTKFKADLSMSCGIKTIVYAAVMLILNVFEIVLQFKLIKGIPSELSVSNSNLIPSAISSVLVIAALVVAAVAMFKHHQNVLEDEHAAPKQEEHQEVLEDAKENNLEEAEEVEDKVENPEEKSEDASEE